jgi:hypothetical protein
MPPFREHIPIRRQIVRAVTHYSEHKVDLKIDFRNRCGYCNDHDSWRKTWYEIDHFVPKEFLKELTEASYSNLVYSCRSCNNSKRAKWPTKSETESIIDDTGFLDPCHKDYNDQFERTNLGRIRYLTNLGEWMFKALKLDKPHHEVVWNIEQADILIDEIESLLLLTPDTQLEQQLLPIYREFRKYVKQLNDEG